MRGQKRRTKKRKQINLNWSSLDSLRGNDEEWNFGNLAMCKKIYEVKTFDLHTKH